MATANTVLDKARSYLGVKESPANSNNVIFNTHYYGKAVSGSAYPWCCSFQWDIFRMCSASDLFCGGSKTAYCPDVENYAKTHGLWHDKRSGKRGDLCLMDFGKGRASHIGIVESTNGDGTYTTIEGNTSASSNDNGGCVMRRTRNVSVIRGFYRPAYTTTAGTTTTSTTEGWVSKMTTVQNGSTGTAVKVLQAILGITVDGQAGPKTVAAIKTKQKALGLYVDGVCGPLTWAKLLPC